MILSLAPMEGLTGYVFRRVHAECFGALDCYYTPFLSPRVKPLFNKRDQKEINPGNNHGLNVIPQLLTNRADAFVAAAGHLAQMGYQEINLNLGCPSGTVASKGKGAGFLRHPEELEAFLQEVCGRSPLPVSVKTRLGVADDAEYGRILPLYCRCPLAELIVHPRVLEDRYQGAPRWQPYGLTLAQAPFPVAYNGDMFGPDDVSALVDAFPQTRHVMLGRGILANPALGRMLRGGSAASAAELERFHDRLFREYQRVIGGNAVFRMKEWWSYAQYSFASPDAVRRAIKRARTAEEYEGAARRVFSSMDLAELPLFPAERHRA